MHVHAGAVVLEQGLGHEGRRHAVGAGDVLDHVFVHHQIVAHARQRIVAHVDLGLAAGGDFVVMGLDLDAEVHHGEDHGGA